MSAGSFRNTTLFNELLNQIGNDDTVEVITTHPNRYDSFRSEVNNHKSLQKNITINKIKVPFHESGILGQIKSYKIFYFKALKIIKEKEYDLVYASSSKLFTALLGAVISRKKSTKLYLDIRDVFRETILDIYKNPILRIGLNWVLLPIENYTFKRADHINFVSEGFKDYFVKYKATKTYYTNGIDPIFLDINLEKKADNEVKTILYAGNIGQGQGLHLIIPQLAKGLKTYKIIIIGDGGVKNELIAKIKESNITNVEILEPINRKNLLIEYKKADFLFLHLNKHKAFERVLPSKLFEYAAFNVPLIAGVSGYAAKFLKENVSNILVFDPLNSEELIKKLKQYNYKKQERKKFKIKYSRNEINKAMVKTILATLK